MPGGCCRGDARERKKESVLRWGLWCFIIVAIAEILVDYFCKISFCFQDRAYFYQIRRPLPISNYIDTCIDIAFDSRYNGAYEVHAFCYHNRTAFSRTRGYIIRVHSNVN